MDKFRQPLARKYMLRNLGPARHVIGWKIDRDRASRTLNISQPSYVRSILADYNITSRQASPTHMINTHEIDRANEKENVLDQCSVWSLSQNYGLLRVGYRSNHLQSWLIRLRVTRPIIAVGCYPMYLLGRPVLSNGIWYLPNLVLDVMSKTVRIGKPLLFSLTVGRLTAPRPRLDYKLRAFAFAREVNGATHYWCPIYLPGDEDGRRAGDERST
jgi:hypothetical protein